MSKKIVIALLSIIILASCIFVACDGNSNGDKGLFNKTTTERLYIEDDEYEFVTDENGEKILNEDGEFVVYVTDEKGKIQKDEDGNKLTTNQIFQPYEGDGFVEEYGFRVTLPEGWKTGESNGKYVNDETGDEFEISPVKETPVEYYKKSKLIYEKLCELEDDGISATWEEDVEFFNEECKNVTRLTLKTKDGVVLAQILQYKGNVYNLRYTSKSDKDLLVKFDEICKAIEFKPYDYYDLTTEATTQETTK